MESRKKSLESVIFSRGGDDDHLLSDRLSTRSRWCRVCNTIGLTATIYSSSVQYPCVGAMPIV